MVWVYSGAQSEASRMLQNHCEVFAAQVGIKMVFMIDMLGGLIASAGQKAEVDLVSLASLTVGTVSAAHGMAKILGPDSFSTLTYEGKHDRLLMCVINQAAIWAVHFDQERTMGSVRFHMRKTMPEMASHLQSFIQATRSVSMRRERWMTDEEVDGLFIEQV